MTVLGNIDHAKRFALEQAKLQRQELPQVKVFPEEKLLGVFCDSGLKGAADLTYKAEDFDRYVRRTYRAPIEGQQELRNFDYVFTVLAGRARDVEIVDVEHPEDIKHLTGDKFRRVKVYVMDNALREELKTEMRMR